MTQSSPHEWLKSALVMIMTMREDDAAQWNPHKLADFARSFSVDALGFSVGGITAFYPTDIPLHRPSPSLNGRDLVGETVQALADVGIKSIGRIDSSLFSKAVAAEHPDWCAVDVSGKPIGVHGHYVACPNGGYYQEFAVELVGEILQRYPLSGLWANAAQFSPWHTSVCYCENCRRKFRAATANEMPKENWKDPLWRRYNELRYRWIAEWTELIHDTIREVRPECAWLPLSQVVESWDHSQKGGWDVDYCEPFEDGLVLEAQRRYTNLWWPGVESRYIRSLAPEKPSGITVSYFLPWWRFYAVPEAENRVWTAQIAAHGARPWLHVTGFFSEHFDRRGLEPMRKMFKLLADNRDAYEGLSSIAEVAIIYSRYSQDNIDGGKPEISYINHFRGAYNALMDQRIPFDVVTDKRITADSLSRYKTVMLPNGACLTDASVAALRGYVEAGGHLVASFEAGFRNEMGERRDRSFVLDMLGVEDTRTIQHDMKAAYGRLLDDGDPLLAGFGDTDLIPIAGDMMILKGANSRTKTLAYVPPVEGELGAGISVPEFNAIEHVSGYSLAMRAKVGKGSLVYFPWQPELVAYQYGLPDLFHLIGNAVRGAADWSEQLVVKGAGLFDVALMAADDRLVLTIINFSAPGSFNSGQRRIVNEIMPVHDVVVEMQLPEGRICREARYVVADSNAVSEKVGNKLRFTLPKLTEFETICLNLE